MATLLRPDQTFYPSPRLASEAPVETLGYMVTFDPTAKTPDALVTIDLDKGSPGYGKQAGRVEMPNLGDELHHFGWNACSSALCPYAPHPHIERRYLLLPGLRSSNIYVFDTKAASEDPEAGPHDHRRRDRRPGGLQPAAHDPLRAGRDLHQRSRRSRWRRAGRDLPRRPRHLHRQGTLGA